MSETRKAFRRFVEKNGLSLSDEDEELLGQAFNAGVDFISEQYSSRIDRLESTMGPDQDCTESTRKENLGPTRSQSAEIVEVPLFFPEHIFLDGETPEPGAWSWDSCGEERAELSHSWVFPSDDNEGIIIVDESGDLFDDQTPEY